VNEPLVVHDLKLAPLFLTAILSDGFNIFESM